jgi:hypothetical protein
LRKKIDICAGSLPLRSTVSFAEVTALVGDLELSYRGNAVSRVDRRAANDSEVVVVGIGMSQTSVDFEWLGTYLASIVKRAANARNYLLR